MNASPTAAGPPRVSVVIPCRSEERFIGPCLDSIVANDYPKDRLEALVLDVFFEVRRGEVMAAGVPVVGPKTGGISETVVDGETGLLVVPGDPAAFAEATARLVGDPALRLRLGEAGRARVRECYLIDRQVERLASIYDEARS